PYIPPRSSPADPTRLSCPSTAPAPTQTPPLSLHDALPISSPRLPAASRARWKKSSGHSASAGSTPSWRWPRWRWQSCITASSSRSEEHTSELQSRFDLVCRLLLEKQNATQRERVIESGVRE